MFLKLCTNYLGQKLAKIFIVLLWYKKKIYLISVPGNWCMCLKSQTQLNQLSTHAHWLPGTEIRHIFYYTTARQSGTAMTLCPTLCNPTDGSPPGSPVPGILQARTLEWVAISFFNAWRWKVKVKSLSHVRLLATPWTAAFQAPPSMGFSRQEYWSGVPLPSPWDITIHLLKRLKLKNW